MKRPSLKIDAVIFMFLFPALLGTLASQAAAFIIALEITAITRFFFSGERKFYNGLMKSEFPGAIQRYAFVITMALFATAGVALIPILLAEAFWALASHIATVEDMVSKDGVYLAVGLLWIACVLFAAKLKKNEFEE